MTAEPGTTASGAEHLPPRPDVSKPIGRPADLAPSDASWRSDRAHFWARSLRGWDLAFYAMWALGVAAFLFERPSSTPSVAFGLAVFAVLLVAYLVLGRRARRPATPDWPWRTWP